jgi:tetratricopeptide (TPR) repeat protein
VDAAARLHPDYPPAFRTRGRILGESGDLVGAESLYVRAIDGFTQAASEDYLSHYRLARTILGQERENRAMDASERERQNDRVALAIYQLHETIRIAPRFLEAYALMGETYARFHENPKPGIPYLAAVLRMDPERDDALFSLVTLYCRDEEWEKALDLLRHRYASNPNAMNARTLRTSFVRSYFHSIETVAIAEGPEGAREPIDFLRRAMTELGSTDSEKAEVEQRIGGLSALYDSWDYSRARDLFQAGDYRGCAALADSLRDRMTESRIRAQTIQLWANATYNVAVELANSGDRIGARSALNRIEREGNAIDAETLERARLLLSKLGN